jgi:hypothetical protein
VLTSSKGDEFSEEDQAWKNGAFTRVLIEAFGKDADENHDGLISMSELTAYMSAHLPMLTGDHQHPGTNSAFKATSLLPACDLGKGPRRRTTKDDRVHCSTRKEEQPEQQTPAFGGIEILRDSLCHGPGVRRCPNSRRPHRARASPPRSAAC